MTGWRISSLMELSGETSRWFVFHSIESSSWAGLVRLKEIMFDCNRFVNKFYGFSYYSSFRWSSKTAFQYTKPVETVHRFDNIDVNCCGVNSQSTLNVKTLIKLKKNWLFFPIWIEQTLFHVNGRQLWLIHLLNKEIRYYRAFHFHSTQVVTKSRLCSQNSDVSWSRYIWLL